MKFYLGFFIGWFKWMSFLKVHTRFLKVILICLIEMKQKWFWNFGYYIFNSQIFWFFNSFYFPFLSCWINTWGSLHVHILYSIVIYGNECILESSASKERYSISAIELWIYKIFNWELDYSRNDSRKQIFTSSLSIQKLNTIL